MVFVMTKDTGTIGVSALESALVIGDLIRRRARRRGHDNDHIPGVDHGHTVGNHVNIGAKQLRGVCHSDAGLPGGGILILRIDIEGQDCSGYDIFPTVVLTRGREQVDGDGLRCAHIGWRRDRGNHAL